MGNLKAGAGLSLTSHH